MSMQEQMVAGLERLLAEARDGQISSMAAVAIRVDGTSTVEAAITNNETQRLLGAIEVVKHKILSHVEYNEKRVGEPI